MSELNSMSLRAIIVTVAFLSIFPSPGSLVSAASIPAQLVTAQAFTNQTALGSLNITAFCAVRPLGLYCHPLVSTAKIECPSGNIFTCPGLDTEFCQERGVLRQTGFKGGIARCAPRLNMTAVSDFCAVRPAGIFCYPNAEDNIRVQCPTTLIYKCASPPHPHSKKCFQGYFIT